MKYLFILLLLSSLHATAQGFVDSFYRDNTMWYTEDRRGLPVRTFYPRTSFQYCKYCGLWRTPAHVKFVKDRNENPDSRMGWFRAVDSVINEQRKIAKK